MKYQEQVDNIMDWFDFDKVHKVMTYLDWTWGTCNEVPSIQEIRKSARDMMYLGIKEKNSISCGGFQFTYRTYEEDDTVSLDLKFVVADWEEEAKHVILDWY